MESRQPNLPRDALDHRLELIRIQGAALGRKLNPEELAELAAEADHETATTEGRRPMLVLTRYIGEKIMIGDEITITLVDIRNARDKAQARIGIEAPRHLGVHREEIHQKIQDRNQARADDQDQDPRRPAR